MFMLISTNVCCSQFWSEAVLRVNAENLHCSNCQFVCNSECSAMDELSTPTSPHLGLREHLRRLSRMNVRAGEWGELGNAGFWIRQGCWMHLPTATVIISIISRPSKFHNRRGRGPWGSTPSRGAMESRCCWGSHSTLRTETLMDSIIPMCVWAVLIGLGLPITTERWKTWS